MSPANNLRVSDGNSNTTASIKPISAGVVDGIAAPWRLAVIDRLTALLNLKAGWDGLSAQPVKRTSASFALTIMQSVFFDETPIPTIVPLVWGGLQLEWHTRGFDLEVVIGEPYQIEIYFAESDDSSNSEPVESRSQEVMRDCIRKLTFGDEVAAIRTIQRTA